jgi:hypothetical protein
LIEYHYHFYKSRKVSVDKYVIHSITLFYHYLSLASLSSQQPSHYIYLSVLNRAHSSLPSISQRTVHALCVTTTNFSYLYFFQITFLPTVLLSSLVIITDYYLYHSHIHIISTYLHSITYTLIYF